MGCNLHCQHCGSDCVRDDSTASAEIGADVIKRELESIAAAYRPDQITFAIIGGEPLIRDDVIEVGAFAARLGFNWGITTNGLLLDVDMVERLKRAELKTISVSLDGVAADHDALRCRKGAHDMAMQGIGRLLEDRFFPEFDIICCVSKLNIKHLAEFIDEILAAGIPAVRFTPIFSRGRAGGHAELMLDKDDYLELLDFVKNERKQQRLNVNLSEEGYWGPQWECVVRDDFHFCHSGILTGSILHDGSVTGCPSVSRSFIEGNIRQTPFVDIWKSEFGRYRSNRKQAFSANCGDCDHWDLCEGGGFHMLDQADESNQFCCLDKIDAKGVCCER